MTKRQACCTLLAALALLSLFAMVESPQQVGESGRAVLNLLGAGNSLRWGLLPVAAQDVPPPGLKMAVEAAFGGTFKYGEWLPVWVELENSGPDIEAEIQVRITSGGGTTIYATPASLPAGSRKRIPVYVLANNFSHELEVQLVQGRQLLGSQKLAVYPRTSNTYVIGLATPERGALTLLQGIALPGGGRPVDLVDVSLATLPERVEGLRSLDCLVLNDVDTSPLTPEQQAAIEAWVGQGGRLVVGGGAGASRTAAGIPASLLPMVPGNVVELDAVSALAEFEGSEPIRVSGPFVVATGEIAQAHVLAAQDGLPLVIERAVGAGYTDLVALDPAGSPFDAWSGTTNFWEQLLSPGAAYPAWLPPDVSIRQMRGGSLSYPLSNLPSLDLPSVQGLAVLLILYIVLVGPASYLVLRWRKRMHWAWITTPLLTILFSAGAFGLAYAMHGTDLILNKIAIVEVQPDSPAMVSSYIGLFSPSQQSYEIDVLDAGLQSPLNLDYNSGEMTFVQGNPGQVRGLTVNQWSMQTFAVETAWPEFGKIVSNLQIEDTAVAGTVRNETAYEIADAALILGNNFVKVGDLAPGAEADVRLEILNSNNAQFAAPVTYRLMEEEMSQPGPTGPPRAAQLKQSVLEGAFQPSLWSGKLGISSLGMGGAAGTQKTLVLIGWLDSAPPEVRVNGRSPVEKTTALLYAPLNFELPTEGHVTIPPGLIGGALIETPVEGGTCGPPATIAVYINRGQAVFEFRLPEEMRGIQAEELTLALTSEGGWAVPSKEEIYDWNAGEWQEYENVTMGINVLSDAGKLISPDGVVRVRLASQGGSSGCYAVEIGVTGTW